MIIKNIIKFFIILFFTSYSSIASAKQYSEIVIDINTEKIIHFDNHLAYARPASLTKLMTLYLIFDEIENRKIDLEQKVTISKKAASQPRSNINLKEGETITIKEAILALIVKSANDAAVILSEAISKDEWLFTEKMNKKARKLGMYNTHFRNSSGLHHDDQFTHAKDMAKLAISIKKHFPNYWKFFSTTSFIYKNKSYYTHNKILLNFPLSDGLKTGYTAKSGFNIISSAQYKDKEIIAIILGASSAKARDKRMLILLQKYLDYNNIIHEVLPVKK